MEKTTKNKEKTIKKQGKIANIVKDAEKKESKKELLETHITKNVTDMDRN